MLEVGDRLLGLEKARAQAETHYKAAEDLLQMLWERATHESHYAIGLKRLASHPSRSLAGSHSVLMDALQVEWGHRALISEKVSAALFSELVDPLRDLLKQQQIAHKKQTRQGARVQKELKACKDRVESMKNQYKKQLQETENVVLMIEHAANLSEKKRMINCQHEDINNNVEKATKMYRDAIKDYNAFLSSYKDEISTALEGFKLQEEQRMEVLFSGLRKVHELEIALGEETVKLARDQVEVFDKEREAEVMQQFQAENRFELSTPRLEEFSPYRGVHSAFQDLCEASPTLCWVGEELQFDWQVKPEEKLAAEIERAKGKIEYIMHKAWTDTITEEDIAVFRSEVEESFGRKLWTSYMNARRASGSFQLTKAGFESVVLLMNIVLDICTAKHDITTARLCTILSQTFHYPSETEKVFLQSSILKHQLWRSESVWGAMLDEALEGELEKQRAYGGEEADTCNVVFAQLTAFVHVMRSFELEEDLIRKIMERRCWEYKLSSEELSFLLETDSPQPERVTQELSRSFELSFEAFQEEFEEEVIERSSSLNLRNIVHK